MVVTIGRYVTLEGCESIKYGHPAARDRAVDVQHSSQGPVAQRLLELHKKGFMAHPALHGTARSRDPRRAINGAQADFASPPSPLTGSLALTSYPGQYMEHPASEQVCI
jgi:hypothetical protein